jgi:hypothetical protein
MKNFPGTAIPASGKAEWIYTASENVWALPNLFTRVYTRLEVVWDSKPLRCRYIYMSSTSKEILALTP